MRRVALLSLVLAGLALPGGAAAASLRPVGTFSSPTFVSAPPGDATRLFVVERGGRIRVIHNGHLVSAPFLNLTPVVESDIGETGLLSMAFAPDYAESGRFYVYYAHKNGSDGSCAGTHTCPPIWIQEFRRSNADPNRADPATARRVLQLAHPNHTNHYGGQLEFGPDNRLWIGTGDGGGEGNPDHTAQSLASLLGKLLRISPRGSGPDRYGIPHDNPFVGQNGRRGEIWAFGLRNPWRFSFDYLTGDLAVGDVGQDAVEEVDFAPSPARGRGSNFGWPMCEGGRAYPGGGPCAFRSVGPVIQRFHSSGACSLIGGYVLRDAELAGLTGRYVYGDLCDSSLRSARLEPGSATGDSPTGMSAGGLASFGEDACGRVYTGELGGQVSMIANGASSCAGADRRRARVSLGGRRRQRGLRRKGVWPRIRCDEACRVRGRARLSLKLHGHAIRTRELRRFLAAHTGVTLRLRLSRRARLALKRALLDGHIVRARVRVRCRDAAGNLTVRSRLYRLVL